LVLVDAHTGGEQRLVEAAAGEPRRPHIGLRAIRQDADIDAAPCRAREMPNEVRVRYEVGIADVKSAAGPCDREGQEALGRRAARERRAVEQGGGISGHAPLRNTCEFDAIRIECGVRQELPLRFRPFRDEDRLQLAYGWSGEAHVGFPPLARSPPATEPFVVEPEAAGIADGAVDHDTTYMGAVVGAVERVPPDRSQLGGASAGGTQRI